MSVRVRFAPSPTGYLHVGAARSALYNYLFARAHGGTYILRSDDTDQARSTDEFQRDILEQLEWLGLNWDEGIVKGGPHGTYRQSDRYHRYAEAAERLVSGGHAYYSFVSPEQLNDYKAAAREAGTSPAYDGSLEPSAEEVASRLAEGEKTAIRFRIPRPGETVFEDVVRGDMRFDHAQVDDFIILRSNGSPTYHLASTVDDIDYAITHVIRGEDLLSSTPKHILLTEAMGAGRATYAHLSLLMGPDGKKLSKRHGDTALSAYRATGFLPQAMVNYLALLGWSAGGDDEDIVSLDDMTGRFDLSTVSRNPAVFDTNKLEWMNGVYIREMAPGEFMDAVLPSVEGSLGRRLTAEELLMFTAVLPLVQERTKLLPEVADQVRFLFEAPSEYDEAAWSKVIEKPDTPSALSAAAETLGAIDAWTTEAIDDGLRTMLEETGLNARKGFQPIRVAISGSMVSPPLFESLEILGRDESLARIERVRDRLDG